MDIFPKYKQKGPVVSINWKGFIAVLIGLAIAFLILTIAYFSFIKDMLTK